MKIGRCIRREGERRLLARLNGQAGFTLIESLGALALVTIAVITMFSALLAVFISSNQNRGVVRSSIEAAGVVERIEQVAYVPCPHAGATADPYAAAESSASSAGLVLEVLKVEYLTSKAASTANFQTGCPAAGDQGLQRITVVVNPADATEVKETIVVMKRDTRCPAPTVVGQTC